MAKTNFKEGCVSVNGLEMYYETYGGTDQPLVLLHDAFSAIGASFGGLLPELAKLFAKKTEMDRQTKGLSAESIRGIKLSTLLIIGDSDLIRPEHAVEMFRLLGGGVFGDTPAGLPNSQRAGLPGTSHMLLVSRTELLIPIITSFLDAPMSEPA